MQLTAKTTILTQKLSHSMMKASSKRDHSHTSEESTDSEPCHKSLNSSNSLPLGPRRAKCTFGTSNKSCSHLTIDRVATATKPIPSQQRLNAQLNTSTTANKLYSHM